MIMSNLTDRIVMLLRTEAASNALAEILDEARDELAAIDEACAVAKEKVLDPFSTSSVVAKAKTQLEDLTLQASRLEAAIDRLTGQLETARAREAEASRKVRYAEAKAERDALAEALLERYTAAAAEIASLLMQIASVDQKVAAANEERPEDAPWLEPVTQLTQISGGWPLANSIRLPALATQGIPDHVRAHPTQQFLWPTGRQ
jgi:DNA repair exonuclease SbcCD ATPase subunit